MLFIYGWTLNEVQFRTIYYFLTNKEFLFWDECEVFDVTNCKVFGDFKQSIKIGAFIKCSVFKAKFFQIELVPLKSTHRL